MEKISQVRFVTRWTIDHMKIFFVVHKRCASCKRREPPPYSRLRWVMELQGGQEPQLVAGFRPEHIVRLRLVLGDLVRHLFPCPRYKSTTRLSLKNYLSISLCFRFKWVREHVWKSSLNARAKFASFVLQSIYFHFLSSYIFSPEVNPWKLHSGFLMISSFSLVRRKKCELSFGI